MNKLIETLRGRADMMRATHPVDAEIDDKSADEIERLRDALKEIDECLSGNWSRREMRQIARAALEDDDG